MKKILLISLALCLMLPIFAQGADRITGVWFNSTKESKIEITRTEEDIFVGHLVWMEEPLDDAGKPKMDSKNSNKKLRNRPLIGLQIISDLVYKGKGKYAGGKIYDPQSGKNYSAKVEMVNNNTLDLRGYVGISLAGRTDTWTRTTK